jgi:hypothetical protein
MLKRPKFGLMLALAMAASVWFYVQRVLILYQKADAAAHARPRGILSDLYPRWLGTRELLLHHRDPYGPEVTREIQIGYYGRTLDAHRPDDPKDEERFAYPVYVVFLLAPTVAMPFAAVQTAFAWILGIVTAASVLLWLRALRWKPSSAVLMILLALTVGSFAAIQGIKLQQLSLLVAALLAGSAALLAGGQLFLAGVLLALATIKPQLVVLPAAWLLLWTLSGWRERQKFFWGFVVTGTILAAGAEYLLQGWLSQFVAGLAAYNRYTGGRSLLDELVTPRAGMILTILFLLSTGVVCWRLRRAPAGSKDFNLALAPALAVTVVVAPMVAPYNHVLLLPAVFLIARSWQSLWRRGPASRMLCAGAALIFFWPWLASLGVAVASIILPAASVQRAWAVPLWSSLGIPLAVLGLLALCIIDSAKTERTA